MAIRKKKLTEFYEHYTVSQNSTQSTCHNLIKYWISSKVKSVQCGKQHLKTLTIVDAQCLKRAQMLTRGELDLLKKPTMKLMPKYQQWTININNMRNQGKATWDQEFHNFSGYNVQWHKNTGLVGSGLMWNVDVVVVAVVVVVVVVVVIVVVAAMLDNSQVRSAINDTTISCSRSCSNDVTWRLKLLPVTWLSNRSRLSLPPICSDDNNTSTVHRWRHDTKTLRVGS